MTNERAAFEEWCKTSGEFTDWSKAGDTGEYMKPRVALAWKAWQAARAAHEPKAVQTWVDAERVVHCSCGFEQKAGGDFSAMEIAFRHRCPEKSEAIHPATNICQGCRQPMSECRCAQILAANRGEKHG